MTTDERVYVTGDIKVVDSLTDGFAAYMAAVKDNEKNLMEDFAKEITEYMQKNAKWQSTRGNLIYTHPETGKRTKRTGKAWKGLRAVLLGDGKITISYGPDFKGKLEYDFYLETSGLDQRFRYAGDVSIIEPTLNWALGRMAKLVKQVLDLKSRRTFKTTVKSSGTSFVGK